MDQMANNIENLRRLRFKKSIILRYYMWRKTAIIGTSGAAGALVGFLICGPYGAAILGVEAVEIAAGLGIGALLGAGTGNAAACTARFWKRSFVSLGKKLKIKSRTSYCLNDR